MAELTIGHRYTREQIHDICGGGLQDYLPHRDGRVVCGCFSRELNPDAPREILPGFGPAIERWAEVLHGQSTAIPVFIKAGTNAWEYVGRFRAGEVVRDRMAIREAERRTGRVGGISMILRLTPAD